MADWLPTRLPEDVEAERSLLATLCAPGMEFRAAQIVPELHASDFVVPKHRALLGALAYLLENNSEVNALTLKDALANQGTLNQLEGFAGLTELLAAEEVGRPEVLADIIQRKARYRRLVRLGAQLVRQSCNEEETPELLADGVGRDLLALVQGADRRGLAHVGRAAGVAMDRFRDRIDGGVQHGVRVGMPTLDHLTHGFQPGELIVLAARPGVGKSTLAQNWALFAARSGHASAFFSLEMAESEVFMRLLSADAKISLDLLRGAREVDVRKVAEIYQGRDALLDLPLFINDQAVLTVPQIQAQATQLGTSGQPIGFLVVDYLQLLANPKGSQAAKQNEAVRVGEISRGLKVLAKDLGIPVVVLSQLNREVEHRSGGRPQLSDLRDSGAIEQDADLVIFIHRRMSPDEGGNPSSSAELIVAKHRNGPTRTISLSFLGETCRYIEQERTTDQPSRPSTPADSWGAMERF